MRSSFMSGVFAGVLAGLILNMMAPSVQRVQVVEKKAKPKQLRVVVNDAGKAAPKPTAKA